MKVLFVSSNPLDLSTLNLNKEITDFQRSISHESPNPPEFLFMPGLPVEQLPTELARVKPDILHISIHGKDNCLLMSSEKGERVKIDAPKLLSWFDEEAPPLLVYLNACESHLVARPLAEKGRIVVVGHTAPIDNGPARNGAVAFYKRILGGHTVRTAFEAAKNMIEALSAGEVSVELFGPENADLSKRILHQVPRLVGQIKDPFVPLSKKGFYSVRLGVVGCPPSTTRIVFFTELDSEATRHNCTIVRRKGSESSLWMEPGQSWRVKGNVQVFAACTTNMGKPYILGSTIKDAFRKYYGPSQNKLPTAARDLLNKLETDT
jgi:hypothetical protein